MGMEQIADYPSSVLWRASLFTTTLGLHGFAHLHPSSHAHTQTHTPIGIHRQKHIYRYTQARLQLELRKSFSQKRIVSLFFISGSLIILLFCVCPNKHRHKSEGITYRTHTWLLFLHFSSYLDSDVELGGLLGGSGSFVNGSIQIH